MANEPRRFAKGITLKNLSDGPNPTDTNPTCNIPGHTWVIDTATSQTAVIPAACICTTCDTFTLACHGLTNNQHVKISTSCTAPTTCPTGLLDATDKAFVVCAACCTFKLSATRAGCAINITAAGAGCLTLTVIEEQIQSYLCSGAEKIVTDTNQTTLTNKTITNPTLNCISIKESQFDITDDSDTTKKLAFTVAGTTGKTTTIAAASTCCRTLTLPDSTDTLVGRATTDTLTNKTIGDCNTINAQDDAFTIQDASDSTKQIDFDAAGTTCTKTTITSSQTANRTLTLPDANDTLVGRATTDTLTNKTLTSPTINGGCINCVTLCNPTFASLDVADNTFTISDNTTCTKKVAFEVSGVSVCTTRTLTVPDASTTIVGTDATQTLTNKTIDDDNNTIQNLALTALKTDACSPCTFLSRDCGGAPISTKAVPAGVVVGTTDTQTLTNKTLTDPQLSSSLVFCQVCATPAAPAANDLKLYAKCDGNLYTLDACCVERQVGSGTGGSFDIFYSCDFETLGVCCYTTGNNATFLGAGCISGTLANETVAPISGCQSFELTLTACSANDWVASPAIAIDNKESGNLIGIDFYYTYTGSDDDVKFVLYDCTGCAIISSSLDLLKNATNPTRFSTCAFIPSTSTNLKWGIQVLCATACAILRIDDIKFSTNPFVYTNVNEITDWEAYTPTLTNFGCTTDVEFFKRRNGDNLEVKGRFTAGTTSVCTASIGLPPCLTIDSTKIDSNSITAIGSWYKSASSSSHGGVVLLASGDTNSVGISSGAVYSGACTAALTKAGGNEVPNCSSASLFFSVPIQGWVSTSEHVVTPAKSNMTDWTCYTPTTNGLGCATINYAKYKQVGDSYHVQIRLTTGTVTAAEAQIGLPPCTTVATGPSLDIVGTVHRAAATACHFSALATAGDAFLNIGNRAAATNAIRTAQNGNGLFGNCEVVTLFAEVPIACATSDVTFLGAIPVTKIAYLKDEKAANTSGGASTTCFSTRNLNTVKGDTEIVTLACCDFTLQPGKYDIEWSAPASGNQGNHTNAHVSRLFNVSDCAEVDLGTTEFIRQTAAGELITTRSFGATSVTITTPTTYRIQHKVGTAKATDGFGIAGNIDTEVYTIVKVTKLK